jgi:hypothetical protein
MTILGKILVFLIFVFSLVTGALIVMVYITKTNWQVGFEDMKHNYDVAAANAKTYRDEVETVRTQGEIEKKRIQDQLEDEKKTVENERADLETRNKALQAQLTATKQTTADYTALQEEAKLRRLETDRLSAQVSDLQGRILKFEAGAKAAQDQASQARIARDSEHQRNLQLVDLNRTMAQQLEEARAKLGTASAGGAPATTAAKPPAEDIQGVVLDSDPTTGLVTISVGSDAGVNKGNTMEVYRLQPTPEYVGVIRIVDSRYHEAVGRAQSIRTGAGPIRKGDRVASRIETH